MELAVVVCPTRTIESGRGGGGRDQPSVLSLRLASSWDDFVSLETEVCGKGEGIGVFFFFF